MGVPGPVGARRRLGTELRRLRSKAGLNLDEVAARVPCSISKLSRLETGKGVPKPADVRRLVELYRVAPGAEQEMLLRLADDGRVHGWWESYTEGVTPERHVLDSPSRYTALEDDATTVDGFCPVVLHGLVQTPDYAAAMLRALLPARPEVEIEQLVGLRVRRQRALTRPVDQLRLALVLDEVVLARTVGSTSVMVEQLRHLGRIGAAANVSLRVLPMTAVFHRAHVGQFAVLGFTGGGRDGVPDVVFVEGHAGDVYLEDARDVALYRGILADVRAGVLDVEASRALIARWADHHGDGGAGPAPRSLGCPP